jgi:hypothetical protein
MHKIFALAGFMSVPFSLCAGEAAPAIQTLGDFVPGLAAPGLRVPEVSARESAERGKLMWSHYSQELYVDGGRQFEYSGRKYAIKLGFERGEYDPYIKNYKAVPGVIVADITGGNYTVWKLKKLSEIQGTDSLFTSGKNEALFNVGYYNNAVYVRTPAWANIASFEHSALRSTWEENAKRYSRYTEKNTTYFVPQSYWDPGPRRQRYGYVISEYAPYYPQSGVPLDYMELFTGNEPYEYKPRTYCLPLGLSFRNRGKEGQPLEWGVKDLTPDALQDAMADELKGGRIVLPPLAGNPPSGTMGEWK